MKTLAAILLITALALSVIIAAIWTITTFWLVAGAMRPPPTANPVKHAVKGLLWPLVLLIYALCAAMIFVCRKTMGFMDWILD